MVGIIVYQNFWSRVDPFPNLNNLAKDVKQQVLKRLGCVTFHWFPQVKVLALGQGQSPFAEKLLAEVSHAVLLISSFFLP